VTGQASTILVYTILGFQTIIAIGFHHICWWSSYHFWCCNLERKPEFLGLGSTIELVNLAILAHK
jgi:hypothetical protein